MNVYGKWILQSVPCFGLGLLMLLSTVTPRQARSNVEAWFLYFGIENIPPWLADEYTDTWVFWIGSVGFCLWATQLYFRQNLRIGKLSVIIREGEPWVQGEQVIDRSQATHTSGKLYTYRIALINSADVTFRNVGVKLTSLEKKPQNFHAIGSHLKLRHDQVGSTNFNVHPSKDPQFLDAMFVDVFSLFVSPEGSSLLRVTSLPEDMNRPIPLDKYQVKIMATSERGEMTIAELAFIPRPDQIPEFRLLSMQSFPGATGASS
jgi:hypothetical protein